MPATLELHRSVLIERSATFVPTEESDGLNLDGHAAVFGQKTDINSWEGSFQESIRSGAFTKTLKERTPVLQFDHGRHPLVGSLPIGVITSASEDTIGLHITARMTDNWLMQPVRDAIANGSVNGMSFRFEVVRDAWSDSKGKSLTPVEIDNLLWNPGNRGPLQRELIELKVPELGPVVFPAYPGTDISARSRAAAYEIRSIPSMTSKVRSLLATGSDDFVAIPGADTSQVARMILFDTSGRAEKIEKVRDHFLTRSLTTDEKSNLTSLLVQLAAAESGIDPIVDALCAADCALGSAQEVLASMLGLPPVDDPEMDDAGMADPSMGNSSMGASKPAPRDASHPGMRSEETGQESTVDAPRPAPIDPKVARADQVRKNYLSLNRIGQMG
jgi:HK97 family phage prohead protease